MSTGQIITLSIVIVLGLAAVLCYATQWLEPRDYDPEPPAKRDPLDIDTEFL